MAKPSQRRANVRGKGAARSGIRLKNGQYKVFDSQRVKDVEPRIGQKDIVADQSGSEDAPSASSSSEDDRSGKAGRSYSALLQSFAASDHGRLKKRRKLDLDGAVAAATLGAAATGEKEEDDIDSDSEGEVEADEVNGLEGDVVVNSSAVVDRDDGEGDDDPFEAHFAGADDDEVARRLRAVQAKSWKIEKQDLGSTGSSTIYSAQASDGQTSVRIPLRKLGDMHLKRRLAEKAQFYLADLGGIQSAAAPYMMNYTDLLLGNRTPENATQIRQVTCLHVLNHVLKGRDRILKNTARLASHEGDEDLELRDQGFTRPKILILTETRQMCAKYAECIAQFFAPDQQENVKRFKDSFTEPIVDDDEDDMPIDFKELFEGNSDNNFVTAIKFTRKTIKHFSGFYKSDIILASPLGLRRIIEHEDGKKRDWDFLSSIEICVVDQADATQMQSFENLDVVFAHLNLQPRDAHGCDFSRVRTWYLDGLAPHRRQTLIYSSYITPELNRLFNTSMVNVAGKVKLLPTYAGVLGATGGLAKQTFSRFDSPSPADDPAARFAFFTAAVLPSLLRQTGSGRTEGRSGAHGGGVLVFVPSYFDFVRVRNHFATSAQTANVGFGAIDDYSEVSAQQRARSHFITGRHAFLLYTQRAHHFFRLRIKGVKKVVFYGLPDNPIFYEEMVDGFLGRSLRDGTVMVEDASVKVLFSKWDGLKLERIVGSKRVKAMLSGAGDTFDFV